MSVCGERARSRVSRAHRRHPRKRTTSLSPSTSTERNEGSGRPSLDGVRKPAKKQKLQHGERCESAVSRTGRRLNLHFFADPSAQVTSVPLPQNALVHPSTAAPQAPPGPSHVRSQQGLLAHEIEADVPPSFEHLRLQRALHSQAAVSPSTLARVPPAKQQKMQGEHYR